jgi:hypothetical protein
MSVVGFGAVFLVQLTAPAHLGAVIDDRQTVPFAVAVRAAWVFGWSAEPVEGGPLASGDLILD